MPPNTNSGLASQHNSSVTVRGHGDALRPSTSGTSRPIMPIHHPGFNPGFQPRHPADITSPMHPRPRGRHENRSRDRALSRHLRFETSSPRGQMRGLTPQPPSA